MKKHLANILTSGNILLGCMGTVLSVQGDPLLATLFLAGGAILDFLDGFVARLTKSSGELGKQLDSLADVVTFGLLPATLLFRLLDDSIVLEFGSRGWISFVPHLAFLITIFSAIRLAIFNLDPEQSHGFRGLPTPANGLLIASFPWIIIEHPGTLWEELLTDYRFLLVFIGVSCLLLVSRIPLMGFKFHSFSLKKNFFRYLLILLMPIGWFALDFRAVPVLMLAYIILSQFQEE